MWPFSPKVRRQLGIDIGTSSVKVVEIEREAGSSRPATGGAGRLTLTNYGMVDGSDFFGDIPDGSNVPSGLKISENDIVAVLKQLLGAVKTKSTSAVMSIPIFSSFLTVMELPGLSGKELESAIPFEARSYIPVPLSEVVLDWLVIPPPSPPAPPVAGPGRAASVLTAGLSSLPASGRNKVSVFLIAAPKEVVAKYQRIAAAAGLKLAGLESESFSLARSLVGNDPGTVMLIDLGARSTNLTVMDRGFIFMSHSADMSGKEITKVIGHNLNVSPARAEELKRSVGIAASAAEKGIAQVVQPFIDKLVNEIERMNGLFLKKENKGVEKIILTGGAANLPGLTEHLSRGLGLEVIMGNPFSRVKFEPVLEPIFRRGLASALAVAAGLAMREI